MIYPSDGWSVCLTCPYETPPCSGRLSHLPLHYLRYPIGIPLCSCPLADPTLIFLVLKVDLVLSPHQEHPPSPRAHRPLHFLCRLHSNVLDQPACLAIPKRIPPKFVMCLSLGINRLFLIIIASAAWKCVITVPASHHPHEVSILCSLTRSRTPRQNLICFSCHAPLSRLRM